MGCMLVDANGGCVIAASSIAVTGKVRVSGGRPLVLVAPTTITFEADSMFDASSSLDGGPGPGADVGCAPPGAAGGGSGGAGGSFGGGGGKRGMGSSPRAGGAPPPPPASVAPLQARRPGAPGG